MPEWSRAWAKMRLAQHERACGRPISDDEWTGLRDWLAWVPIGRPKMTSKLGKLTMSQALEAQRSWHDAMAARSEKQKEFGGAPDAVETVMVLGSRRWVRILTPEGLDFEGNAMGHCVGTGPYDKSVVFSLRDADNMPHCTLEWGDKKRCVSQVQGRANKPVAERYHADVRCFVESLNPLRVMGAGNFDHVFVDGKLMHWSMLPDDLEVAGDLDVSDCDGITRLPSRLVVGGDLWILRCPGLETLPRELCVRGEFYLDCPDIAKLLE